MRIPRTSHILSPLRRPCLRITDTAYTIFLVIHLTSNIIHLIEFYFKYKNITNIAKCTFLPIKRLEIDNADKPWAQELSLLEELNTLFRKHKFHTFLPIQLWHLGLGSKPYFKVEKYWSMCIFTAHIPLLKVLIIAIQQMKLNRSVYSLQRI